MLKGLYFKLHDDHEKEKDIIDFFDQESKKLQISKMELLKICIGCYKVAKGLKWLNHSILQKFNVKPVCECTIQGEPDKIMQEFKAIIKGICKKINTIIQWRIILW